MAIRVEAVFVDGVLKPSRPLPLEEHEKVQVTIQAARSWAERTAGMLQWTGDAEVLRRVIEDPRIRRHGVAMTFGQIPPAAAVFLDANTLIFHFRNEPTYGLACTRLIQRVEVGDLSGFTSAHALADVALRLMTLATAGRRLPLRPGRP